jgi:hypothetical protein
MPRPPSLAQDAPSLDLSILTRLRCLHSIVTLLLPWQMLERPRFTVSANDSNKSHPGHTSNVEMNSLASKRQQPS